MNVIGPSPSRAAAIAALLRRLAEFIDSNRDLVDTALMDAKQDDPRPPKDSSAEAPSDLSSETSAPTTSDTAQPPARIVEQSPVPSDPPIDILQAVSRLTIGNGIVARKAGEAGSAQATSATPSNPLLEELEPILEALRLYVDALHSLVETRDRPNSISARKAWDGCCQRISMDAPDSWLADPRVTGQLDRERLKAFGRRYTAAHASVAQLSDLVGRHPEIARRNIPPSVRELLTRRCQAIAVAQAGIRTEIDRLRAELPGTAACPLQDRLFRYLRTIVDRNGFGIFLSRMRRDEVVERSETEALLAEIEAERTLHARAQADRRRRVPVAAEDADVGLQEPRYISVVDAFDAARADFGAAGEGMVFTDRARQSAEESPFVRPDDVYDALQSLWKAIQTWRGSPEGAIGTTVKELLRQSGYDEKRCSTAAIGKNPAEYSMVFRGRSITIEQHMTLGSGNPNTCLSIHWWRDESTRELVVGHCGRHLSNSLT